MRMDVHVLGAVVHVKVQVERSAPPPEEQPGREGDDDGADRRFGKRLHGLRQVRARDDHRNAEHEQPRRMTEPPGRAETAGSASGAALAPATSVETATT